MLETLNYNLQDSDIWVQRYMNFKDGKFGFGSKKNQGEEFITTLMTNRSSLEISAPCGFGDKI